MYVDEVYYHDMFKGEPVDDTDFLALCQRAGEIIEEMTLYRLTEEGFAMMPENTQKLVKNAVCAQIEYLDASIRGDGSNQLESIRRYRCTVHASCFSRRNINCYRYNFRSYKAIAI